MLISTSDNQGNDFVVVKSIIQESSTAVVRERKCFGLQIHPLIEIFCQFLGINDFFIFSYLPFLSLKVKDARLCLVENNKSILQGEGCTFLFMLLHNILLAYKSSAFNKSTPFFIVVFYCRYFDFL
jgi:hypothetical protein